MSDQSPVIDPANATSTVLRGGHALEVRVPYRGEISMRARREASRLLRPQLTDAAGEIRSTALALEPPHLIATAAGSRQAIAELQSGALARAAAAAITQAISELSAVGGAETRLERLHAPAAAARSLPSWWQQWRRRKLRA